MKVIVATDSFKGTLTSSQAGQAIRDGVLAVAPQAQVVVIPMADGGEGTVEAVLAGAGGRRREVEVPSPLGTPVTASFGLLDDGRTAVLEMAASSGLLLVPPENRDPTRTSTYGTGCQIAAALERGATRVLIGVGGSATVDGGCGCAQALGVLLLDAEGSVLSSAVGGGDLERVMRIDADRRDERLAEAEVIVLSDVNNPLCGPDGAAYTFGPQKGATPEQVERLDRGLRHLADIIERDLGIAVAGLPGGGAAGGLGGGLVAFAGATIRSGVESIIELTRLDEAVRGADLVITGEGRIDAQSMMGKVVSGVACSARTQGVPVIAIAGSEGPGAEECLSLLNAYYAVHDAATQPTTDPSEAMRALTACTARHVTL